MAPFFVDFPIGPGLFLLHLVASFGHNRDCGELAALLYSGPPITSATPLHGSAVPPETHHPAVSFSLARSAIHYDKCPETCLAARSSSRNAYEEWCLPDSGSTGDSAADCLGRSRPSQRSPLFGWTLQLLQAKPPLRAGYRTLMRDRSQRRESVAKETGTTEPLGRETETARPRDGHQTASSSPRENSVSTTRAVPTVPYPALEWKRYPYDFARGEFAVGGFPLYVDAPDRVRPPEMRQDADTGESTKIVSDTFGKTCMAASFLSWYHLSFFLVLSVRL